MASTPRSRWMRFGRDWGRHVSAVSSFQGTLLVANSAKAATAMIAVVSRPRALAALADSADRVRRRRSAPRARHARHVTPGCTGSDTGATAPSADRSRRINASAAPQSIRIARRSISHLGRFHNAGHLVPLSTFPQASSPLGRQICRRPATGCSCRQGPRGGTLVPDDDWPVVKGR
jgi:hypothetical protein